jgi:hypothetical protein
MVVIEGGAFCVGCFNFVTDQRVVDLGASWEGGVQDGLAVDDLRLCEGCVTGAAAALSVSPSQVEELKRLASESEVRAEQWKAYAEKLEEGLAVRPEKKAPVKRKAAA